MAWRYADNVGAGAGARTPGKATPRIAPLRQITRAGCCSVRGKQQQEAIWYSVIVFKDNARSAFRNVKDDAIHSSVFFVDDNFSASIVDVPAGVLPLFRTLTIARIHRQKMQSRDGRALYDCAD